MCLYLSTSNLVLNKGWIMDEGCVCVCHEGVCVCVCIMRVCVCVFVCDEGVCVCVS